MNRDRLTQILFLVAGTCLTAMGTVIFFTPNRIVCGGISGVSTILFYVCQLPIGISYAVLNATLLLIGFRVLGREFIVKTVIGTGLMSLFMELLAFVPQMTEDGMLAAVFGGIFYGVGLGLTFISRGSTGGTDILGRLIQAKFPRFKIGALLAAIDVVIILSSAIVFRDMDLVLYGVIGVIVQSFAIDALIDRFNIAHMVYVVTDRGEYVREFMRAKYDRGVTELEAYGYANEEGSRQLLVCAMNAREAASFKEELAGVDPDAFVMFTEAKSVLGKGFKYYK